MQNAGPVARSLGFQVGTIEIDGVTYLPLVSAHSFAPNEKITAVTTHQGWWLPTEAQAAAITEYIKASYARQEWQVLVRAPTDEGEPYTMSVFDTIDKPLRRDNGAFTVRPEAYPVWYDKLRGGHQGTALSRMVLVNNHTHCYREIGLMWGHP